MYIIDYDKKLIGKFEDEEVVNFLNKIIKKRYIFAKDELDAKAIVSYAIGQMENLN